MASRFIIYIPLIAKDLFQTHTDCQNVQVPVFKKQVSFTPADR